MSTPSPSTTKRKMAPPRAKSSGLPLNGTLKIQTPSSVTASCRSGGDKELPTLTWYVFDEPNGERFAEANARLKLVRELDSGHPALINYLGDKLTGQMVHGYIEEPL